MIRRRLQGSLALAAPLLLFLTGAAVAEEGTDPKSVTYGFVRIKMNTTYAKCHLNGAPVDVEFEDEGQTVVLASIDRTKTHEVKIMPVDGQYGSGTVKIVPKDFRLEKVGNNEKAWRAHKRIKLPKAKSGDSKKKKDDKGEPAPVPEKEEEED
jgi:hypothetical protein